VTAAARSLGRWPNVNGVLQNSDLGGHGSSESSLPVSHSQSYDQSLPRNEEESDYKYRRRVDSEHIEYRKNLKSWYKTHTPETP
jgi:hypothetical protein